MIVKKALWGEMPSVGTYSKDNNNFSMLYICIKIVYVLFNLLVTRTMNIFTLIIF